MKHEGDLQALWRKSWDDGWVMMLMSREWAEDGYVVYVSLQNVYAASTEAIMGNLLLQCHCPMACRQT